MYICNQITTNKNIEIMKNFTAIYSTASIANINYSFKAENLEKAFDFCREKFDLTTINGGFSILQY